MKTLLLIMILLPFNTHARRAKKSYEVVKVKEELENNYMQESIWADVNEAKVTLMGQPMVKPKPQNTETPELNFAAVHDGKWIVFRMKWKSEKPSAGGRLATESDAVALEFPMNNTKTPPAVFMGGRGAPVHIFHWKYIFQRDLEFGRQEVSDLYPNMVNDMYPMDYKIKGSMSSKTKKDKDMFLASVASGNPVAYNNNSAVDELLAEGFSTVTTLKENPSKGYGLWENGEWIVYIARPLNYANASKILLNTSNNVGFAVWQGERKEVGAIKSVTMSWTKFVLGE